MYQHKHIRSALGYLTLAMFEFVWRLAPLQPNEGIPLKIPKNRSVFRGRFSHMSDNRFYPPGGRDEKDG